MNAPVTERQITIIRAIVSEYVLTGQPVGSQIIVDKFGFDFSSATVRKEMSILEQMGLLNSPHTSAGRVPTDDAFRVYIADLVQLYEDTLHQKTQLEDFYRSAQMQLDQVLKTTAQMLSITSNQLGVVLAPGPTGSIIKRVEVISVVDNQVLIIMVSSSGGVYQKKIRLDKTLSQEDLYKISKFLNAYLPGHEISSLQIKGLDFLSDAHSTLGEHADTAVHIAQSLVYSPPDQNVIVEGENNFVRELLESHNEKAEAHKIIHYLQNRSELCSLINTIITNPTVSVQIGIDIDGSHYEGITILTRRYSVGGAALGALGVIGTSRMPYDRLIPAMNYGARMLSEVLSRRGEISSDDDYIDMEALTILPNKTSRKDKGAL